MGSDAFRRRQQPQSGSPPDVSPSASLPQPQLQVLKFIRGEQWEFLFLWKGSERGTPIKLLYTKVQLNSEGALLFQPVEAYWLRCAQPLCTKKNKTVTLLLLCYILPPLFCLNSDATSLPLSHVQLASELCLSSQTGTLFICTVPSLGWCNDFKKTINDIWKSSEVSCMCFYFHLI